MVRFTIIVLYLASFSKHFQSEEINKDNLFNFLNSKQFISSNFTQITKNSSKERVVKGSIKATRNGSFRLEYFEPFKEIISSDSDFLYKVDLELEQVDIIPRQDFFKDTPISLFITQSHDLNELYSVDDCIKKDKTTICTLSPLSSDSFIEKLSLRFSENLLISLRYEDAFEQSILINFSQISWKPFDKSELLISFPEGIDVVYH
tara:strand:- start:221 stop:835 length:615 start_codon:yes stop_codon:yes gene_type:complete